MLPEDPKSDMAKILLFIFAFIMVFVGNTTGVFSSEKSTKQMISMSSSIFGD